MAAVFTMLLASACALSGCRGSPAACEPGRVGTWDWEGAGGLDDFVQEECDGDVTDTGWASSVSARAEAPGLRVVGEDLTFGCGEDVEGFYRRDHERVVVLVQPVDLHPKWEAGCTCRYRVEAGVPEDPPAAVSLYERGHGSPAGHPEFQAPDEPELVGCVEVEP